MAKIGKIQEWLLLRRTKTQRIATQNTMKKRRTSSSTAHARSDQNVSNLQQVNVVESIIHVPGAALEDQRNCQLRPYGAERKKFCKSTVTSVHKTIFRRNIAT